MAFFEKDIEEINENIIVFVIRKNKYYT